MSQNNNIDIDIGLYDRQLRTYGIDAVKKMTTSSVLIMGLSKGLGTEVGKNLALGGIRNIYLLDSNPIISTDLETGIYYTPDSIGKPRSQVLAQKLQELNPYVTINCVDSYEQQQNVTILINQPTEIVAKISKQINSKLVVLYSGGVSGVVFVDAGLSHMVLDATGETIDMVQIGEITIDGMVKCAVNSSHDFQSGDYITFSNLEGENISQFEKEWVLRVINKTTFQLENFVNIEPFKFINGTCTHIKKPIEVNHQNWSQQCIEPSIGFSFDMDGMKQIIDTYIQMYSNSLINTIPYIWSEENVHFMHSNNIKLPEQARTFNMELIPVVSLMGSITASEAIKLVTNKYMPANQWFVWTDNQLIPKIKPSRVTDSVYGTMYGGEFESKLINSSWLVVGSGAIGCEHLKNLAYMNVATGENSHIILTDPDSIEKSNLNRQFLFRSHHIGKPKSTTAVEMIKQMNPRMNISARLDMVGTDNIHFTDKAMGTVTGVLNALDNIKARRFMDEQCFRYGLPLFESGTTGTKGNTQPVIPFITETYSNSSDMDQEKSFPICTIKSFPNDIVHTIHWAMDQFVFFNRAPSTVNKWIETPNYLDGLVEIEQSIAKEDIYKYTSLYPTQHTKLPGCVEWAIDMFNDSYYNMIKQLLDTFGPNHEVTPGVPFWSAGKRCPKPIKFDATNSLHLDWIEATTHLLVRTSGLYHLDSFTRGELVELISQIKPKELVHTNEEESKKIIPISREFILGDRSQFVSTFVPQDFEKDDEYHISWINAASNMRAENYSIPIVDKQQTKGIAGRIIPAIATTTSAVSGMILLEMLKYLQDHKIETYRSSFINLAEPILIYSEPIGAPDINIAGVQVNSWTKFEYKQKSTLGEFKKYYEELFKCEISMIVFGSAMIYADFIGSEILDNSLESVMDTQTNVIATLGCDEVELPQIRIIL